MDALRELKETLALKEVERRDRYAQLPQWMKSRVRSMHHDVHPWSALADEYPHTRALQDYAALMADISELQVQLALAEEAQKGPPDLRLGKVRKYAGY